MGRISKWAVVALCVATLTAPILGAEKELSATAKGELAKQELTIAGWAAAPEVVKAVVAQNAKGPLPGMDNEKWKAVKRSDPLVKAFMESEAGKFLAAKLAAGKGLYTEAFLSAAQGEKVAFTGKTTSYSHKGKPKFEEPLAGKTWLGAVEFDESTQTYSVQIAVPVLAGGKPVGVLVVGVNVNSL